MEQIKISVYTVDELNQKAYNKAYQNWYENKEYLNSYDNKKTLDAFLEMFGIELKRWEYDSVTYFYCISGEEHTHIRTPDGKRKKVYTIDPDIINDDIQKFTGVRLLKYLYNNYGHILYKPRVIGYKRIKDKSSSIDKIVLTRSKIQKDHHGETLTGYFMDYEILKPIYEFIDSNLDKNKTILDLIHECLDSFFEACINDMEAEFSENNFKNDCLLNDTVFFKDGTEAVNLD